MAALPPRGAVRPSPGDITISPDPSGYVIGEITADEAGWRELESVPTWAAALRAAGLRCQSDEGRVLVSREGEPMQVLDLRRLWLGQERRWQAFDYHRIVWQVPPSPGIYVLRGLTPVFVGETDNLRERLLYHLLDWSCDVTTDPLEFCYEVVDAGTLRTARAADLISWWSPPCNQHA
jgi:hypothetical protein